MLTDCLTRRGFLAGVVTTAMTATVPATAQSPDKKPTFELCAFEKFIQNLSYDDLADTLAELGFQGVEATVRRGGRIEAADAEEKLPRLHEALAKRGLAITVMTTDLLRADDPVSQKVISTAASKPTTAAPTGPRRKTSHRIATATGKLPSRNVIFLFYRKPTPNRAANPPAKFQFAKPDLKPVTVLACGGVL